MDKKVEFLNLKKNNLIKKHLPDFKKYQTTDITTINSSIELTNIAFNSSFLFEITPQDNQLINNFVLELELSKLVTSDINPDVNNAYNFYANELGYSIFNSIEVIIGNETIFEMKKSLYGNYLDMINELNDGDFKEWESVQKFGSLENIKKEYEKGVTKTTKLMIPLKLWCDKDINHAIPSFLLKKGNKRIKIKINTRKLDKLQFKSSSGNQNNTGNIKIEKAILHYKEHTFNDEIARVVDKYYSKKKYELFYDDYKTVTYTLGTSGVSNSSDFNVAVRSTLDLTTQIEVGHEAPLQQIIFLFKNLDRHGKVADDQSEKFFPNKVAEGDRLNYNIVDNNNNAIFNFEKIKVKQSLQGADNVMDDLSANYLNKIEPLLDKKNVPKKNIYVINFGDKKMKNYFNISKQYNQLTMTFTNIFQEYSNKTTPSGAYNYEIVFFYKFIGKLSIDVTSGTPTLYSWNTPDIDMLTIDDIVECELPEEISEQEKLLLTEIQIRPNIHFVNNIFTKNNIDPTDYTVTFEIYSSYKEKDMKELFKDNILTYEYYLKAKNTFFYVYDLQYTSTIENKVGLNQDLQVNKAINQLLETYGTLHKYTINTLANFSNCTYTNDDDVKKIDFNSDEGILYKDNFNKKVVNEIIADFNNDVNKDNTLQLVTHQKTLLFEKQCQLEDEIDSISELNKKPDLDISNELKCNEKRFKTYLYIRTNFDQRPQDSNKMLCNNFGIFTNNVKVVTLSLDELVNKKGKLKLNINQFYNGFRRKYKQHLKLIGSHPNKTVLQNEYNELFSELASNSLTKVMNKFKRKLRINIVNPDLTKTTFKLNGKRVKNTIFNNISPMNIQIVNEEGKLEIDIEGKGND